MVKKKCVIIANRSGIYVSHFDRASAGMQGRVVLTWDPGIAMVFASYEAAAKWARKYADAGYGLNTGEYTVETV